MDWTLFISAFLSATLLPGSSEALLLYRLSEQEMVVPLLISATSGNILGSIVTYYMGVFGNTLMHKRWLGIDEKALLKAEKNYQRWGIYSLLLAWLPVIGDPLCLVAGLMRVNLIAFIMLAGIGKLARYSVLIYLVT
ncbi:MAG: DedA family protein [Gammaproteobacteria bacterium]|nr:DedA family protein [Gammaproteobacteria bacterium]